MRERGAKVALFITAGFRDLLEIGSQARPDIFSLCIEKSSPLYSAVVEVDERTGPEGNVEKAPDTGGFLREARKVREEADVAAVVFMHSWRNPANELACLEVLRRAGFTEIILSHRSVNLIKMVTRGQSAMVDAYLSPVIALYMEGVRKATGRVPVEFITSSGGLVDAEGFFGREAVLSGPAGGVVAVGEAARALGLKGAIGFDMGGTSTDVSKFEEVYEKSYEQTVAGVAAPGRGPEDSDRGLGGWGAS